MSTQLKHKPRRKWFLGAMWLALGFIAGRALYHFLHNPAFLGL